LQATADSALQIVAIEADPAAIRRRGELSDACGLEQPIAITVTDTDDVLGKLLGVKDDGLGESEENAPVHVAESAHADLIFALVPTKVTTSPPREFSPTVTTTATIDAAAPPEPERITDIGGGGAFTFKLEEDCQTGPGEAAVPPIMTAAEPPAPPAPAPAAKHWPRIVTDILPVLGRLTWITLLKVGESVDKANESVPTTPLWTETITPKNRALVLVKTLGRRVDTDVSEIQRLAQEAVADPS